MVRKDGLILEKYKHSHSNDMNNFKDIKVSVVETRYVDLSTVVL